MRNNPELLACALRGFAGDVDEADSFGLPDWRAHVAGAQLYHRGVSAPVTVSMGRNKSLKVETVGGATWVCTFAKPYLAPRLERVS